MMNSKTLCVIPARGKSKRLKNKNILNFCGKPLVAWTIKSALECDVIDKVIVSTDSEEIAKVAKDFGAEVPFLRPDELSRDTSGSFEVIEHALDYFKNDGVEYNRVVFLQPTSPLRDSEDVKKALELFEQKNARGVISVTKCAHSPLWTNVLDDSLSMNNFIREEIKGKRSQDLPTYYRLNGAIYIYSVDALKEERSMFFDREMYAYIMDGKRSVDIDTKQNFTIAEAIAKSEC